MEYFKEEDIKKWEVKEKSVLGLELNQIFTGTNETDIELPFTTVYNLIGRKRPEYMKYFPYEVNISYMTEEEKNLEWINHSFYLGVNNKEKLDLKINKDKPLPKVALLWIIFHEFRHKIQYENKVVSSCVLEANKNISLWRASLPYPSDLVDHVWHEIIPFEIDANTFACEMLDIEYPGSKFDITEERLKKLYETKNW